MRQPISIDNRAGSSPLRGGRWPEAGWGGPGFARSHRSLLLLPPLALARHLPREGPARGEELLGADATIRMHCTGMDHLRDQRGERASLAQVTDLMGHDQLADLDQVDVALLRVRHRTLPLRPGEATEHVHGPAADAGIVVEEVRDQALQ